MRNAQTRQRQRLHFIRFAAIIAAILFISSTCSAQMTPAAGPSGGPQIQQLLKNPALLAEFGILIGRFQHELHYPPPRSESRLLPLLPGSTMSYAAFSNYGEVARQALQIFREELQKNPALREWWQHSSGMNVGGPMIENSFEKFSQLSEYLGNEIVVSGAMDGSHSRLLIVAEVRKPGLKEFLQQTLDALGEKSKARVRVIDRQGLTAGDEHPTGQELVVLVRPDYVIASLDLATLRSFSAQLDRGTREFGATPFAKRISQAYEGGVTILEAADLQRMLSQVPLGTQQSRAILQSTGFGDMKYLIWEHKRAAGQFVSQSELSFIGPRHGIASWLAAPAPLGSLDFLSPDAMLAGAVQLKDPAQIFDDVKEIADASRPGAFAALEMMEQGLNLSVKDDLLGRLGGEIGFQVDLITPRKPAWKVLLRVNDPGRLQQTLTTLLALGQAKSEQSEEGGITYYKVRIPRPEKALEINYAFASGYLIVSGTHEGIAEAIRVHDSGASLGKSKRFLASLPLGHPSGVSAVLYEDPIAVTTRTSGQLTPGMAGILGQWAGLRSPLVICAYGEPTAIREASTSIAFDAGAAMVVAAIAIPNLLRSRVAANEASAVGSIRTVVTAQVTYAAEYPDRGYARDLATLGPAPGGSADVSADHAGLLDTILGNSSCTAGAWCTKSGFRFSVKAVCIQQTCADFVVSVTPVAGDTGARSFCATSDGVVRARTGPPLTSPVSLSECRAWRPLQ